MNDELREAHRPLHDPTDARTPLVMLDLCSGRKGASAAMSARGWTVTTVDNDPDMTPDILADVRDYSHQDTPVRLVWASPPCTEFAKAAMPWFDFDPDADMSIVEGCRRIIRELRPVYWIIENTRGAVYYFGPPAQVIFPYYLWGRFPRLSPFPYTHHPKSSRTSADQELRALIPYSLSLAVCLATERQLTMPGFTPDYARVS